ncbi:MAG: helix-turn-helix domain-containing protein [Xenococcaceae cyanobacterium]
MIFIGTTEAASLLGISTARVRQLLAEGRIKGAYKSGKCWLIPVFDRLPSIKKGTRGPKSIWRGGKHQAVTKIYINRHKLAQNSQKGTNDPVISVNRTNKNICGHEIAINGPCRIVYDPQLQKNPRIWIETFFSVRVIDFELKIRETIG